MIVLAVGLSGIAMAGWAVNHLDLAPPYAGNPLLIDNNNKQLSSRIILQHS